MNTDKMLENIFAEAVTGIIPFYNRAIECAIVDSGTDRETLGTLMQQHRKDHDTLREYKNGNLDTLFNRLGPVPAVVRQYAPPSRARDSALQRYNEAMLNAYGRKNS